MKKPTLRLPSRQLNPVIKKPIIRRPPLQFQIEKVADPLEAMKSPDEDVEEQSVEALTLIQQAFRDQEKKLADEIKNYRSIDFFRVLVFATPVQAQAFSTAVGEDIHQQYMDGRKICDRFSIVIPNDQWRPKRSLSAPNRRLKQLAMPMLHKTVKGT